MIHNFCNANWKLREKEFRCCVLISNYFIRLMFTELHFLVLRHTVFCRTWMNDERTKKAKLLLNKAVDAVQSALSVSLISAPRHQHANERSSGAERERDAHERAGGSGRHVRLMFMFNSDSIEHKSNHLRHKLWCSVEFSTRSCRSRSVLMPIIRSVSDSFSSHPSIVLLTPGTEEILPNPTCFLCLAEWENPSNLKTSKCFPLLITAIAYNWYRHILST